MHVGGAMAITWLDRLDERIENCPFLVVQITGIALSSHAPPPHSLRLDVLLTPFTPFLVYHFSHSFLLLSKIDVFPFWYFCYENPETCSTAYLP